MILDLPPDPAIWLPPKPAIVRAVDDRMPYDVASFLPSSVVALTGRLQSFTETYFASVEAAGIAVPTNEAQARPGDFAVYIHQASSTSKITNETPPTGWTLLGAETGTVDSRSRRIIIAGKILTAGDLGSAPAASSHPNQNATLIIYRPNKALKTFAAMGVVRNTNQNPSHTIPSAGAEGPIIVLSGACINSGGAAAAGMTIFYTSNGQHANCRKTYKRGDAIPNHTCAYTNSGSYNGACGLYVAFT